jgi:hypothetical protein
MRVTELFLVVLVSFSVFGRRHDSMSDVSMVGCQCNRDDIWLSCESPCTNEGGIYWRGRERSATGASADTDTAMLLLLVVP